VTVSGRSWAAYWRSAASAEMGGWYGALFTVGAGAAGATGSEICAPVSVPHAAAPKATAAAVAMAAVAI